MSERFVALDCADVTFKDYENEIKLKAASRYNIYKEKSKQRAVVRLKMLEKDCDSLITRAKQGAADWVFYNYYVFVNIVTELILHHPSCDKDKNKYWTAFVNRVFEHLESKINLHPIYDNEIKRIKEEEKKKEEDRRKEQLQYLEYIPKAEIEARKRLTEAAMHSLKDIYQSAAEQRPLDVICVSELSALPIHQPGSGSLLGDLFSSPTTPAQIAPSFQAANGAAKLFSPEPIKSGVASLLTGGGNQMIAPSAPIQPTSASRLQKVMFEDPTAQVVDAAREQDLRNKILGINKTADQASTQHDRVLSILSAKDEEIKKQEEMRKQAEEQQKQQRDLQLQEEEENKRKLLAQQQRALKLQEEYALKLREEQEKQNQLDVEEQQWAAELEATKKRLATEQQELTNALTVIKAQNANGISQVMQTAQPYLDSANLLQQQCNNAIQSKIWDSVELLKPTGIEVGKQIEAELRMYATQLSTFSIETPSWQTAASSIDTGIQAISTALELAQAVQETAIQQREGLSNRSQINDMRKQLPHATPITPGTSEDHYAIILRGELQKLKNRQADRHRQYAACNWSFPLSARASQPRRGFVNLGNTCYMNSILQSLLVTPLAEPFKSGEILSAINILNPLGSTGKVANTFSGVVEDMQSAVSYPISPSLFKRAIGQQNETFEGQRQQDANEFLQTLLSCLHEDLNLSRGKESIAVPELTSDGKDDVQVATESANAYKLNNNSLITDVFGFLERSTVTCPLCKHRSVSFTVQQSLLLPIDQTRDDCTIVDSLYKYTDQEKLPEGNEWLCPTCNIKSRADKQLSLWSHPRILVLALNRFCTYGNLADKIRTPVKFPEVLDLSSYVISTNANAKVLYELTSIVNHDGGMGGGHYTCDVKGSQDGQWHHFSDERHHPVSGSPNFAQAYILFYKLKTN